MHVAYHYPYTWIPQTQVVSLCVYLHCRSFPCSQNLEDCQSQQTIHMVLHARPMPYTALIDVDALSLYTVCKVCFLIEVGIALRRDTEYQSQWSD
jgi:hypothetical protein